MDGPRHKHGLGGLVLVVKLRLGAKPLSKQIGCSSSAYMTRVSQWNIMQDKKPHIAYKKGIELLNVAHAKASW